MDKDQKPSDSECYTPPSEGHFFLPLREVHTGSMAALARRMAYVHVHNAHEAILHPRRIFSINDVTNISLHVTRILTSKLATSRLSETIGIKTISVRVLLIQVVKSRAVSAA
jgi:hypothetical protein